jgi:hypothetical protein
LANELEQEVPVARNLAEGLKYGLTSTGRQLGVVGARTHGLVKIQYIDGKPGSLPERLQGRYTGTKTAQHDLDAFITETWKIAAEKSPRKSKVDQEVAA